ncbi:hypothetical protein [uncultured Algibacter sp.]|uniref:hypothetical protein n=1 Tax=uncultured Algibacter sp. TaxID=298659 RepID=UPI0032175CA1
MKKYLIIFILLFSGIALVVFNRINLDIYKYYSVIIDFQLLGLIIILISILLTLRPKLRNPLFLRALLIFTILLISSELVLSYKSFQEINRVDFIKNYDNKNCNQLIERLEFDKTQNKFAYFAFGLSADFKGIKLKFKEKYNVDVIAIGQGCIGNSKNHCYNIALIDFLDSKKNNQ